MTVEPLDVSGSLLEAQSQYKSTQVTKAIPYELDVGNLTAFDPNALDETLLFQSSDEAKQARHAYLTSITRDGVQVLMNDIFSLPTNRKNDITLAVLPTPTSRLPRAKPIPKEKPMTRWEKFAAAKGIKKVKKATREFDEATGEWVQKFGYKHGADKMDDWLVEVPETSDPMEDQYEKSKTQKKELVDKNARRARRNAEESSAAQSGQNPRTIRKKQLETALKLTRQSTASLGKFDKPLHNEDKVKIKAGIKRKFDPTSGDADAERKKLMAVAERVIGAKSQPVVNLKKAVSHVAQSKHRPKLDDDQKKRKGNIMKGRKGKK
ncbi:hypothetical protein SeMB42_g04199 [Synchytrium endobioticum]|uniref:Ribosome biogenesis regulatory protein n=1 Tax=Synchytrium endobioticum TaxID=286115 RepID=A0A507D1Z4_9FUNG|nr:hypothetical protein SeMB42_g04199 [Synchytrium endobioticum]TPX45325.1 hypothetical protein SeLEV6574_g03928 [Synchytrium endobioticum]